jgi:hypothetical protein
MSSLPDAVFKSRRRKLVRHCTPMELYITRRQACAWMVGEDCNESCRNKDFVQ